ncbi:MAG: hypothetical protein ACLPZR_08360 [Solirubrobacteraceae bacterium]
MLAVLPGQRLERSAGSRRPVTREALRSGARQLRVGEREATFGDQPGGELRG